MSGAFAPRGTQFLRSVDGVSYTKYAEVSKIDRSGMKANLADVTNLDSPSAFEEVLPTTLSPGEAKLDLNFINTDAEQNLLMSDYSNQTSLYWRIQFPGTRGKEEFQGYVTDVGVAIEVKKQVMRTVTIACTGQPTWTPNV